MITSGFSILNGVVCRTSERVGPTAVSLGPECRRLFASPILPPYRMAWAATPVSAFEALRRVE
jgi:hypothetical protein